MPTTNIRVSQLPDIATPGNDNLLLVSILSATVTLTASTISAQASDQSFNDSALGFTAFAADDQVQVSGFTGSGANNLYSANVTGATLGKLTIGGPDGAVIVDDAAGESVTITKWESVRMTLSELAAYVSAGGVISAADITYTPDDDANWPGTVPALVSEALDEAATRLAALEAATPTAGSPITYTVDTGSTADSDPGAGLLKFDNGTQSSATTLYLDNATADGVTLTTYLASIAQRGFVSLVQSDDPAVWRLYKITAVIAASGYYKLTVINQAGAGSFADDVLVRLAFAMSDSQYSVGFFFTTTPTTSEILLLHTVAQAVTFPDDFAGSVGDIGTNPSASFVLGVQKNGSSVGSITISTGGSFTFATTGSAVSFAIGDQLKIVGPGTADSTAANVSITLLGVR